jgi:RND superfamily putative drug exporter
MPWRRASSTPAVTAAAAIMATVFFSFALADLVVVKAIGIGLGIAVVVDATVVRMLLVPATMRLLGRWNWWPQSTPSS